MDNLQSLPAQTFGNKINSFFEQKPIIYQFLRFACIGMLNTALDFLLLNIISKAMGISSGWRLGAIDVFSFSVAIVQSYVWNKTWTFGAEQGVSFLKNFMRLAMVGLLGAVAIIFVLLGSRSGAPYLFFLAIFVVYMVFETVLWRSFNFHLADWRHEGHSFLVFAIVTFVGLGINVALVSILSVHVHITHTVDLDKNIAKILATCISLFWNFVGYKVVVFKK